MTFAEGLLQKHRGGRVLLDTNLLLLLLVGSFQRERVPAFKRTAHFSLAQFDRLGAVLSEFGKIVTTPHVLTEVNSLANALPDYLKFSWHAHFAEAVATLFEVVHSAEAITQQDAFLPFGFADAAVQLASSDVLLLTEDNRLASYLRANGTDVLTLGDLF